MVAEGDGPAPPEAPAETLVVDWLRSQPADVVRRTLREAAVAAGWSYYLDGEEVWPPVEGDTYYLDGDDGIFVFDHAWMLDVAGDTIAVLASRSKELGGPGWDVSIYMPASSRAKGLKLWPSDPRARVRGAALERHEALALAERAAQAAGWVIPWRK